MQSASAENDRRLNIVVVRDSRALREEDTWSVAFQGARRMLLASLLWPREKAQQVGTGHGGRGRGRGRRDLDRERHS